MEQDFKKSRKFTKDFVNYLLDLPDNVRRIIMVNELDFEDLVVVKNVNKELREWMMQNDIALAWERKWIGRNDYWRSLLLQIFSFEEDIVLQIDGGFSISIPINYHDKDRYTIIWHGTEDAEEAFSIHDNPFYTVFRTFFPDALHLDYNEEDNSYVCILSDQVNTRKELFQYCYTMMIKHRAVILQIAHNLEAKEFKERPLRGEIKTNNNYFYFPFVSVPMK